MDGQQNSPIHSVLGFRPFSLPPWTSITWTPTAMSASATLTPTATARKSVFLPSQGFPNLPTVVPQPSGDNSSTGPTVLLVLLPVLFGSLMLLAIGLGVAQYYRQRAREQQRQSGLRTARLRRGSTHPFTTHEMSVVNRPDLETGFSRYDQSTFY